MERVRSNIVLIPDYSFTDRIGCDVDREGILHKRCNLFCKDLYGRIGTQKITGGQCIGCGFTFWIDPFNGGVHDRRDKETIWLATKATEEVLNDFGIEVEEETRKW